MKKFVYWRSNFGLSLQKMIQNYDLGQLITSFLTLDMKLYFVEN